jgi:hypothetical protein
MSDDRFEQVHVPALLSELFGVSRSEARRAMVEGGVHDDSGARLVDFDMPAEHLRGQEIQFGDQLAVVPGGLGRERQHDPNAWMRCSHCGWMVDTPEHTLGCPVGRGEQDA